MGFLVYLSNLGMGGGTASIPPIFVPDKHDGGPRKKHKGKREHDEERLAAIRRAFYAVENEDSPPAIVNEIRASHAEGVSIDFRALQRDTEQVETLLAAYRRMLDDEDDEDMIVLL